MDENLREQGLLSGVRKSGAAVGSSSNSPLLTFDERMHRNKAIQDIEDAGFAQTAFKSSRAQVGGGRGRHGNLFLYLRRRALHPGVRVCEGHVTM